MDIKAKRKFIIIGIIAVVVVLILVKTTENIQKAIFKKKPAAGAKIPGVTLEEEAVPVKVIKAKKIDFKDTLPSIGNVKGFKEVDLRFQAAGVIESMNFEDGEKVQEGDIIASLVQRDALLKLKYAEVELNKNKKLFEIGAIAPMKMDQAKLEYESAKSDLDKTNIYAMFNGLMVVSAPDARAKGDVKITDLLIRAAATPAARQWRARSGPPYTKTGRTKTG